MRHEINAVLARREPRQRRSSIALTALTLLLASLATAALAHVAIDLLGTLGAGGDAYDDHAHATVAPVALGAVASIGTLLLRSALRSLSCAETIDPALVLARRFGTMSLPLPAASVTLGGLVTLIGMEFTEQLSAFGHIEGVADALGGNAFVGLAIVCCIALAVTLLGLRCARAFIATAVRAICVLAAWIVEAGDPLTDRCATIRRARERRCTSPSALRSQRLGLRAPPLASIPSRDAS
jgi:hypothetical protein